MQVQVMTQLRKIDGTPIIHKTETGEAPMLLKTVLINALLSQDEKSPLSGEAKVARFTLAQAIYTCGDVLEIGNSDVAMMKKLVNDCYPTLVVGQVYELLK